MLGCNIKGLVILDSNIRVPLDSRHPLLHPTPSTLPHDHPRIQQRPCQALGTLPAFSRNPQILNPCSTPPPLHSTVVPPLSPTGIPHWNTAIPHRDSIYAISLC
jgi:hypothetical protein